MPIQEYSKINVDFLERGWYSVLKLIEEDVMDNIVYLITHNGVDGRGKTEITQAYYSREERDKVFSQLKFQGYYSQRDKIIQEDKAMKETISKLNGIDRLLLDIGQEHLILKEDK